MNTTTESIQNINSEIKSVKEEMNRLKEERRQVKKAKFEEKIVSHFGRPLVKGDRIACEGIRVGSAEFYEYQELVCIEGSWSIECFHVNTDGTIVNTLELALQYGYNQSYTFSFSQIKTFQFELLS